MKPTEPKRKAYPIGARPRPEYGLDHQAGSGRPPVALDPLCAERQLLLVQRDQLRAECNALLAKCERLRPPAECPAPLRQLQFQDLHASFETLEKKCNHYANLYDFAPVGYVIFDAAGAIQEINKAGALLLGWEHARLIGQAFANYVVPDDQSRFQQHVQRCQEGAGRINTELVLQCKDGALLPVELVSAPFQSPAEQVTQYRTAIIDISQRQRAKQELQQLHQNYKNLVNALESIVWEAQAGAQQWQFTLVSQQAERLLGYPLECWRSEPDFWQAHLHPEDRAQVLAARNRALAAGRNYLLEYRMLTADQRSIWLRDNVTVTRLPGGQLKLQGVMVNLSELKEAEQALRKTYDELEKRVQERTLALTQSYQALQHSLEERRRLENELLEITERERHRIALDLHDELGQRLAGISLMLKSLHVRLAKKTAPEASAAQEIQQVVSQTIEHAHDLTRDLAAWEVKNESLAAALRALSRRARAIFGVRCEVQVTGRMPSLDASVANQLYKIAQEATTNAIKHGRAKRVVLRLAGNRRQLLLRVTNNGRPFPKLLHPKGGFGLRIMQYRANLIGASLEIRPNGKHGASVQCALPAQPAHGPLRPAPAG